MSISYDDNHYTKGHIICIGKEYLKQYKYVSLVQIIFIRKKYLIYNCKKWL